MPGRDCLTVVEYTDAFQGQLLYLQYFPQCGGDRGTVDRYRNHANGACLDTFLAGRAAPAGGKPVTADASSSDISMCLAGLSCTESACRIIHTVFVSRSSCRLPTLAPGQRAMANSYAYALCSHWHMSTSDVCSPLWIACYRRVMQTTRTIGSITLSWVLILRAVPLWPVNRSFLVRPVGMGPGCLPIDFVPLEAPSLPCKVHRHASVYLYCGCSLVHVM